MNQNVGWIKAEDSFLFSKITSRFIVKWGAEDFELYILIYTKKNLSVVISEREQISRTFFSFTAEKKFLSNQSKIRNKSWYSSQHHNVLYNSSNQRIQNSPHAEFYIWGIQTLEWAKRHFCQKFELLNTMKAKKYGQK